MDQLIWQNIINGDKRAYENLYILYFKKFYNYGRKFTPDEVLIEDSIQELFLDIWTKKEKMLRVSAPNQYFFSSFRYLLFKKIRQSRRTVHSTEFMEEPEFAVDQAIVHTEAGQELRTALQAALQALTSRQREAIFLRFYEGLSYEEVAAVLNISIKATYKIMARSLESLKGHMPVSTSALLLLIKVFG